MHELQPAVYLLASARNGTLHVGVTSTLMCRVAQHKQDQIAGFTSKYRVHDLVWFELHPTMESAIHREKKIKECRRAWKLRLIELGNPRWEDLFKQLI
jgi:putative endonuclease